MLNLAETLSFVELLFKTLETNAYLQPEETPKEDGNATPPKTDSAEPVPPETETEITEPVSPSNSTSTIQVNGSAPLSTIIKTERKSESEKEEKKKEKEKEKDKRPRSQ